MRRYDKEGCPRVPTYYVAPLRRPNMLSGGARMAWDQCDTWVTAAEWLAWLRRSGRRYRVFGPHTSGKWVPMSRPIIDAHELPWSTRKVGGFAKLNAIE